VTRLPEDRVLFVHRVYDPIANIERAHCAILSQIENGGHIVRAVDEFEHFKAIAQIASGSCIAQGGVDVSVDPEVPRAWSWSWSWSRSRSRSWNCLWSPCRILLPNLIGRETLNLSRCESERE
jgi:hypothetical protein